MWINEIGNHKYKKYSQYGEEGYLKFIFKNIGTTNRFLVDIGANDGKYLSNTKLFRDEGWQSVLIEAQEFPGIHNHFVTAENIKSLLIGYGVPYEFDLLSIDIDGNDYWVLSEILCAFSPRVIISEYNSEFTDSRAIEYNPGFQFKATDYYGYTFEAGLKLAEEFGYKVVFQNSNLNMYYIRKDIIGDVDIEVPHPEHLWWRLSSPTDTRKWIMI
jgi:hypothetical protein